jgi:hypothetical protein
MTQHTHAAPKKEKSLGHADAAIDFVFHVQCIHWGTDAEEEES